MTDDKALEAARAAYRNAEENPRFVECPRCKGVGYHHGFGEDGNDPDWCSQCGGSQQIMPADEADRPLIEAISAYLSALPGEAEVVALVDALRAHAHSIDMECMPEESDLWAAADALQSLHARAEKAERERDEANAGWEHTSLMLGAALSRAEAAEARVKELEQALRPFAFEGLQTNIERFDGETQIEVHFPRTNPRKAIPAAWVYVENVLSARSALKENAL